MIHWPPSGADLAIGLAGFLLLWYVVGMQMNRRRAVVLVRQVRESLQPFGGTATIRWYGRSAFRIEAEQLTSPFVRLGISVVLEPRETFFLWIFGRFRGRRDWLVTGVGLNGEVGRSFEVYHPQRRGAFQVASEIREKGWQQEPIAARPSLLCAGPTADDRRLAHEIVTLLSRIEVWRVGLRPEAPHLTISLPVPTAETTSSLRIFGLLPQLAHVVLSYSPKN